MALNRPPSSIMERHKRGALALISLAVSENFLLEACLHTSVSCQALESEVRAFAGYAIASLSL